MSTPAGRRWGDGDAGGDGADANAGASEGALSVQVHWDDSRPGWPVVELAGSCRAEASSGLTDVLFDLVVNGCAEIVLDVRRLTVLDPVAGRVLVTTARFLSHVGGRLVVCDPNQVVRRALEPDPDRIREVDIVPGSRPRYW